MVKAPTRDRFSNELHLTLTTVPAGTVLHRIHLGAFQAAQFNPTGMGNARFSPIRDAAGNVIPTLYAGTTFDCAAMESIFHDVPYTPGYKTYPKRRLAGHEHSTLEVSADIQVVDLTSKSLRRLGIERRELIDTEADSYPTTRNWAQAIHTIAPQAQGLRWVSRQDDTAVAMVLFGDRVAPKQVAKAESSYDLLAHEATYSRVMDLAEVIGVLLVSD